VPGATVDVLDVSGTWKYRERPFDPKSKEEIRDDYRVIWVVVADKDEATHIRLSGPRETVEKHYAPFVRELRERARRIMESGGGLEISGTQRAQQDAPPEKVN